MKFLKTLLIGLMVNLTVSGNELLKQKWSYTAIIDITYEDQKTNRNKTEKKEGDYGTTSRIDREEGIVVHVRTQDKRNHACTPIINKIPSQKWIALVERGKCRFSEKIRHTTEMKNASAVVIYNNSEAHVYMEDKVEDVVSVIIGKADGQSIAELVDSGLKVYMVISVGKKVPLPTSHMNGSLNRTSVLFVSISFIVLLIISLAWLVFYYIQRFRYAHAKERLSKRLMHAAKKAISKMPMRTLKSEDKEVVSGSDQCAVCIEEYTASDVIRILPCKHIFHKSCVDPWLIEHRSCPMCKRDILKPFGLQIHNSEASLVNLDLERGSTSIGASDVLHGLDSGLTEDADNESHYPRQHRIQMVCYHALPSTSAIRRDSSSRRDGSLAPSSNRASRGSASAVYCDVIDSRGVDTDSSSDGQPVATCIEPEIHCSGLDEDLEVKVAEQSVLLPKCTCTPKHKCPPGNTTIKSNHNDTRSCNGAANVPSKLNKSKDSLASNDDVCLCSELSNETSKEESRVRASEDRDTS